MTPHEAIFDIFRKAYPGSKRGLEVEFDEFVYSCRKNSKFRRVDWRKELPSLLPALEADIADKKRLRSRDGWVAEWKNLDTWLHARCWTRDIPVVKPKVQPKPVVVPVRTPATDEEVKAAMATLPWRRNVAKV